MHFEGNLLKLKSILNTRRCNIITFISGKAIEPSQITPVSYRTEISENLNMASKFQLSRGLL